MDYTIFLTLVAISNEFAELLFVRLTIEIC